MSSNLTRIDGNRFLEQDRIAHECMQRQKESDEKLAKGIVQLGGSVAFMHDEMLVTIPEGENIDNFLEKARGVS